MEWLLGKRCNCTDWLYTRAKKENYIEILFFTSKILTLKKLMFNCHKLLTCSREVPLRIWTCAACCSLVHSKFDKGSRSLHWQGIGKWIWDSPHNSNSWFPFDALSLLPPKLLLLLMDAHICFLMNYCCLYASTHTKPTSSNKIHQSKALSRPDQMLISNAHTNTQHIFTTYFASRSDEIVQHLVCKSSSKIFTCRSD
jgi:hypothetical protein